MIVAKGQDRIAIVGESVTVKLPRSNPVQFGNHVRKIVRKKGPAAVIDSWTRYDTDQYGSLKRALLRGVVANQRETRLARNFGQVVIPTVSILGGMANLQPTSQPLELPHREIHGCFVEYLGPLVTRLGHMLEDPSNLGIYDGMVRFVDGGSRGLGELMKIKGDEIGAVLETLTLKVNG